MIRFIDVTIGYGRRVVLSSVSFTQERGTIAALLGPNGGGKTTLLRALLGEISPRHGRVEVAPEARIGYVPQVETEGSFWPLRVRDFVGLFARSRAQVERALAAVGIGDLASRSLQDLSGGQRQKALLAKALVNEPTLLVLDEPTQGMDVASEADYLDLLRRLNRGGCTIVLVTHLLHVAMAVAHTVVIVDRGKTHAASVAEILDGGVLDAMYGRPFARAVVGGTPCVVVDRRPHE